MQEKNSFFAYVHKQKIKYRKNDKIAIILDGLGFGFYTFHYEYYKQIF